MGWERGRYYTRSRKVDGRVVREYVGIGEIAQLSAELDAAERADHLAERAERNAEKSELEALETQIRKLTELVDLAGHAALAAAGYHLHNRGEWRKRRGIDQRASED